MITDLPSLWIAVSKSHLALDVKGSAYSFCMCSMEVLDCLVKGSLAFPRANDWVVLADY